MKLRFITIQSFPIISFCRRIKKVHDRELYKTQEYILDLQDFRPERIYNPIWGHP